MARRCAAVALVCILGAAGAAGAASSLRLPEPAAFGELSGATLDAEGIPLGSTRLVMTRDPRGRVVVESESAIVGGESVRLYALLEPAGDGGGLRPVEQRSRTLDPSGELLSEMTVDHESGRASCATRDGEATIDLPAGDRVANVPISLLLLPLARGETEALEFQAVVCRDEPRLLEVSAHRTGRVVRPAAGTEAVEIEYRVELNPILARIARPFLPRILFWIDPAASADPWVAHQMPLFPKGPTVFVVRGDLAPDAFLAH